MLVISTLVLGWNTDDRVLLRDVKAITLHKGKKTAARRSSSIQQLQCHGSLCGADLEPHVVQCEAKGDSGRGNVQWACTAELDPALTFDDIDVSCEGYGYAEDDYILSNSCGLRYSLRLRPGHRRPDPAARLREENQHAYQQTHHQQQYARPASGYPAHAYRPSTGSGSGGMGAFLGLMAMLVLIARCCFPSRSHTSTPPARGSGGYPGMFGGWGNPSSWFGGPSSWFGGGSSGSSGYGSSGYGSGPGCTPQASTGSGIGGFWTGIAGGGLLGYLFGRRRTAGTQQYPQQYAQPTYQPGYQQQSYSSSPSHAYTRPAPAPAPAPATGYGGTSRR